MNTCCRCRRCCCSVCYYSCRFSFRYVDTVCGFTPEYLDLIDYKYYTVRCCTTWEYVFVDNTCLQLYLCHSCCCCVVCCNTAVAAAAAACCCCSSSCAGKQNLLLWFIASDCSVFFLFIQTRFIFNVPVGSTVAFTESIFYL